MPTLTIWVQDYHAALFPLDGDDNGGGREAATLTGHIRFARCHSKHSARINPSILTTALEVGSVVKEETEAQIV